MRVEPGAEVKVGPGAEVGAGLGIAGAISGDLSWGLGARSFP